jgi:hypothetical protein
MRCHPRHSLPAAVGRVRVAAATGHVVSQRVATSISLSQSNISFVVKSMADQIGMQLRITITADTLW